MPHFNFVVVTLFALSVIVALSEAWKGFQNRKVVDSQPKGAFTLLPAIGVTAIGPAGLIYTHALDWPFVGFDYWVLWALAGLFLSFIFAYKFRK